MKFICKVYNILVLLLFDNVTKTISISYILVNEIFHIVTFWFSLFSKLCYLFCYLLLIKAQFHSYGYLYGCYLLTNKALFKENDMS